MYGYTGKINQISKSVKELQLNSSSLILYSGVLQLITKMLLDKLRLCKTCYCCNFNKLDKDSPLSSPDLQDVFSCYKYRYPLNPNGLFHFFSQNSWRCFCYTGLVIHKTTRTSSHSSFKWHIYLNQKKNKTIQHTSKTTVAWNCSGIEKHGTSSK